METHDGFSTDEWMELIRRAIESDFRLIDGPRMDARTKLMLAHQRALRQRAARKFSDGERWLWTSRLLEQASDERVARLNAEAFPGGVRVIDFCCGGGADSVALAGRGPVTAVDRSQVACELTRANIAMHFHIPTSLVATEPRFEKSNDCAIEVVCTEAEGLAIQPDVWVHVDPDRRANQYRTTQPQFFEPGLQFLASVIDQAAGGSIKVAPTSNPDALKQLDRVENPSRRTQRNEEPRSIRLGRQFIAWGGSVRQQRWWWHSDSYPAATITASILSRSQTWIHWRVGVNDLPADDSMHWVENWEDIEGYVGDADGVIRAAGLQGLFANQLKANLIGGAQGFLQCCRLKMDDALAPFIDWFEIEEVMPFDRKRLRAYFRQRKIGGLEIKVRNVEVLPETLRQEMKLHGTEATSLLITKCGGKTIAIVAKPLRG